MIIPKNIFGFGKYFWESQFWISFIFWNNYSEGIFEFVKSFRIVIPKYKKSTCDKFSEKYFFNSKISLERKT